MAILFRTHLVNRHVLAAYERLRRFCSSHADVWFLYHCESGDISRCPAGNRFVFSSAQVHELCYRFTDFWYEGHYPLLLFQRAHPDYDYYWMVEYDVRYTGDWWHFLDSYSNQTTDFLAAYLLKKEEDPDWPLWQETNFDCAQEHWRRSFYPVVRLSSRAIQALRLAAEQGITGHCERITPSVLLASGLTVGDLNDTRLAYTTQTYGPEYRKTPFVRSRVNVLYHPAYGLSTRRGLVHFLHRLRKKLNLLEIKPRLRRAADQLRAGLGQR